MVVLHPLRTYCMQPAEHEPGKSLDRDPAEEQTRPRAQNPGPRPTCRTQVLQKLLQPRKAKRACTNASGTGDKQVTRSNQGLSPAQAVLYQKPNCQPSLAYPAAHLHATTQPCIEFELPARQPCQPCRPSPPPPAPLWPPPLLRSLQRAFPTLLLDSRDINLSKPSDLISCPRPLLPFIIIILLILRIPSPSST